MDGWQEAEYVDTSACTSQPGMKGQRNSPGEDPEEGDVLPGASPVVLGECLLHFPCERAPDEECAFG